MTLCKVIKQAFEQREAVWLTDSFKSRNTFAKKRKGIEKDNAPTGAERKRKVVRLHVPGIVSSLASNVTGDCWPPPKTKNRR